MEIYNGYYSKNQYGAQALNRLANSIQVSDHCGNNIDLSNIVRFNYPNIVVYYNIKICFSLNSSYIDSHL